MSLPPLSRTTALCLALGSAGCVIGNDKYPRPRDLSDVWFVDRTRILAIRADPPEVTPGQNATFSALVARPETTEPSDDVSLWLACSDEEGSGFGCDLSALTNIDPANADITALQEAGLIGFEPFLSPSYTPDPSLLDGLEGQDRLEGVYVTIAMSVFPASVFESAANPYTQALLKSAPKLDVNHRDFFVLSGDVPSPIDPPSGCRFQGRCSQAMDKCKSQEIPIEGDEVSHFRCLL